MDIQVPQGAQLQERACYWVQYRAYEDAAFPVNLGDPQAQIQKFEFCFTIASFQKRLRELTLVDYAG